MGYHPHLIDTDIGDILYLCPRSPPLVCGREETYK